MDTEAIEGPCDRRGGSCKIQPVDSHVWFGCSRGAHQRNASRRSADQGGVTEAKHLQAEEAKEEEGPGIKGEIESSLV